jgi:hypothetical protein
VPNFGLVTRIHVLTAIRTSDEVGAADFLSGYGIEGPAERLVVERGRRYDPRALLAFAYEKATGTRLSPGDVPADAAGVLERLDFRVVSAEDGHKSAPKKRTPRVAKPKVAPPAKREPVVQLCPRCMMQLPASGQCDYCD